MTDPTDGDLIRASRRKRTPGAPRSKLRLWLDANLDDLIANPPDWEELVERLSSRRPPIRDAFGRKLKAPSVQRLFSRVKAERHAPKPARMPSRAATPEPEQTYTFRPTVPRKEP